MDQSAQKVHISSTMHRTFGRGQWQQLRDLLTVWKNQLTTVHDSMQTVATAQNDIVHKAK